jgi:hypothetical protein
MCIGVCAISLEVGFVLGSDPAIFLIHCVAVGITPDSYLFSLCNFDVVYMSFSKCVSNFVSAWIFNTILNKIQMHREEYMQRWKMKDYITSVYLFLV